MLSNRASDEDEKISVKDVAKSSDLESEPVVGINIDAERKLVRKLDWALLPLFTLICELVHGVIFSVR